MLIRNVLSAFATSILLTAFAGPALAQSLGFSPQRVVIEGRDRSASLALTNRGEKTSTFRVELVDLIYQPDGGTEEVADTPPGYPSAKPHVRFSPRQVRLAPGETQNVRILVRGLKSSDVGEYRVHARLAALPDVSGVQASAAIEGAVAGVVGVAQAVAIPIIVRRGDVSATGRIASVRRSADGRTLDMVLARSGNRSLYTDLVARAPDGSEAARIKGIALPVPNAERRFFFRSSQIPTSTLLSGGYTMELVDRDTGEVLDRKAIN